MSAAGPGCTVSATLIADPGDFRTRETPFLDLGFEGVAGDHHAGLTRRSGGREPWYPRGTEIRNERQLSIVCPRELADIAERLSLPALQPGWIGANLVLAGFEALTTLPRGARLVFPSGAAVIVTDENHPCRQSGRAIARQHPGREDIELSFGKLARGLRGIVASVERPGRVSVGEAVLLRPPR